MRGGHTRWVASADTTGRPPSPLLPVTMPVVVKRADIRHSLRVRPDRRLGPVLHPDLFQDGLEMNLDGALADLEVTGDLFVLGAVEKIAEDLRFAVREAVDMTHLRGVVPRHGPDEQTGEIGGKRLLSEATERHGLLSRSALR